MKKIFILRPRAKVSVESPSKKFSCLSVSQGGELLDFQETEKKPQAFFIK